MHWNHSGVPMSHRFILACVKLNYPCWVALHRYVRLVYQIELQLKSTYKQELYIYASLAYSLDQFELKIRHN